MLRDVDIIGIISIDASEAGFGMISGDDFQIEEIISSGVGGKTRAGGQSARRFERLREMNLTAFYTRVAEHAKKIGVLKHYSIDAKDEFVTDYVFPCIKANGFYEKKYPLSTALARPLIASKLVEIANKENAFGVAHGCTGKGNDQVRFDVTVKALNPKLKVIAPVREWNLSRDDELKFAKEKGLPVKEKTSVFSTDQNIWGRSIESGSLEDPNNEPPEDAFKWVNSIEKTPDTVSYTHLTLPTSDLV